MAPVANSEEAMATTAVDRASQRKPSKNKITTMTAGMIAACGIYPIQLTTTITAVKAGPMAGKSDTFWNIFVMRRSNGKTGRVGSASRGSGPPRGGTITAR